MIWTEESAALLSRAYRYGTAVKTLADWIEPLLAPGAHVCDVGCGVGALSLELARRGFRVTALDISKIALGQLKLDMGDERINVLCEDAKTHTPDRPYDAMVFSFFGSIEECLGIAASCCTDDVFYVSRDYQTHRFSVKAHPVGYRGYRQALEHLNARSISHQAQDFELDMGQPFVNLEEARRFFALYSRDDPALITDEFLKSRLLAREGDYPLYLPHMRRAGAVHIHVKDIPPMNAGNR